MTDWFESLEARERLFVAAGAVIVVLALIYGLAWAPLDKKHAERKMEVDTWQRAITELRPLRARPASGQQPGSAPANNSRQSLITIVDQTLRSRNLDSYRRNSRTISSNGINVVFDDVAFDELILWLGDLSEQYDMHVQIASFSTNSQVPLGRTNASVTLERAL